MPIFPTQGGQVSPFSSESLLSLGLGLLAGKTPQEQVANAASNVYNNRNFERMNNQTLAYLKQNSPDLAQAVESGAMGAGDAFKLAYQQKLEAAKPKNNYLTVGKNLYNIDNGQWISPPAGAAGADIEAGLTPVYGKDANGKTVAFQPLKSGGFRQVDIPAGIELTPGVTNLDLGTSIRTINTRTGEIMSDTPKDLAGAESQKAQGEAAGKAISTAPTDLQAGQNALDTIEAIRNDPYKARGTGFSSLGNSIPGTGGYDFQNKVNAAKSGAFLTAIQSMRGLGALSEQEGSTATKAVNRMDTATSEEEFNAALNDYEKIVRQGMARAQSRLQGGGVSAPTTAQTPGVDDLLKKYGGQ